MLSMIKFIETISAPSFSRAKRDFYAELYDAGYEKKDIFSWNVDVISKVLYHDAEPIDVYTEYEFEVVIRGENG